MREELWSTLTGAFMDAAIGHCEWHDALDRLAGATGSRHGQLLGLGPAQHLQFNYFTSPTEVLEQALDTVPVHDPRWNTRVGRGFLTPLLESMAEADFIDGAGMRQDPHYRDFALPCDIPYSCVTPLERDYAGPGTFAGLGVFRTHAEGPIQPHQRALFESVAPAARAALRAQLALEGQAAKLLSGVLDALSVPALLLDQFGRVQAATAAADALLRATPAIDVTGGRLYAGHSADARILDAAVLAALHPDPGRRVLLQTVVARGPEGGRPLILDVIALPVRESALGFVPRVLVVAGGMRRDEQHRTAALVAAYGLTDAEASIAVQLAEGAAPEAIATRRRVTVGTVRAQIKTVLAKLGVKRQIELVARLRDHPF